MNFVFLARGYFTLKIYVTHIYLKNWEKVLYKFLGITMMPNTSYGMVSNNYLPLCT